MPYKEVIEQEDLLVGPYGSAHFDEESLYKDPYWLQITDDGQFALVISPKSSTVLILEYNSGEWTEVTNFTGTDNQLAGVGDILPQSHTVLFNDRDAGGIVEYDIDNDTKTLLFTCSADGGATYWPFNRDRLQFAVQKSSVAEIRDKQGNTVDSVDTGRSLASPAFFWNQRDDLVLSTTRQGGPPREHHGAIEQHTLGGAPERAIRYLKRPTHVYARGPYATVGLEDHYGLIMETSGVAKDVIPMKSNMYTIRDPAGREGFKFVGTYFFNGYEFGEQMPQPIARHPKRLQQDNISSGETAAMTLFVANDQKISASIKTSASGADITHFRAEPHFDPFVGYSTPFWDGDSPDQLYRVDERSGNELSHFEVEGVSQVILGVENNSGSDINVRINAQR